MKINLYMHNLCFILLSLIVVGCSQSEKTEVTSPLSDVISSENIPDWMDSPNTYFYSATFVGVIIINNNVAIGNYAGEGDILAAFDAAGFVRGVAVQLIPPFGPHEGEIIYEMQVRSNDDNDEGDVLTFKYYDASEDVILDIEETYEFLSNDILGDVENPITFHVNSISIVGKFLYRSSLEMIK